MLDGKHRTCIMLSKLIAVKREQKHNEVIATICVQFGDDREGKLAYRDVYVISLARFIRTSLLSSAFGHAE